MCASIYVQYIVSINISTIEHITRKQSGKPILCASYAHVWEIVKLPLQVPTQYSNFGDVIRNIQNKLGNRDLKSNLKWTVIALKNHAYKAPFLFVRVVASLLLSSTYLLC